MITYKIKYKGYISSLYLPEKKSGKTVLLLPGLPTSSNIDKLVQCFLDVGCCVFYPQLAGSFDSSGKFDGFNHILEVKNIVKMAHQRSFKELYFCKSIDVGKNNEVILVGMSYSGLIALLGDTKEVSKILLLSPVLLYNQKDISKIINFDFKSQMKSLLGLLSRAFSFSYRLTSQKLMQKFLFGEDKILRFDSVLEKLKNLKKPTLVVHGRNDSSVPYQIDEYLVKKSNNKAIDLYIGDFGHSNGSYTKEVLDKIKDFV